MIELPNAAPGTAQDENDGRGDGRLSLAARARLAKGVKERGATRPDLADDAAVAAWRDGIHRAWGEGTMAGEVDHVEAHLAGVAVAVAGPEAAPVTVLYAHGGGYALGSSGVAAPITARLARVVRVVSVDYRLAPRHPFPAALDDVCTVYRQLCQTTDAPVALAGDSAGGALVLGVALRGLSERWPKPAAIVLFCPHLDHLERRRPLEGLGDDLARRDLSSGEDGSDTVDPEALAAAYRNGVDPTHPLLSPARAPLSALAALAPTLVQTGTADPLHHQAVRFARRARSAGAPVELDLWEGLWHTWQYHRELPEAHRALDEAITFLLRHA